MFVSFSTGCGTREGQWNCMHLEVDKGASFLRDSSQSFFLDVILHVMCYIYIVGYQEKIYMPTNRGICRYSFV
jgi:hypothetical protein